MATSLGTREIEMDRTRYRCLGSKGLCCSANRAKGLDSRIPKKRMSLRLPYGNRRVFPICNTNRCLARWCPETYPGCICWQTGAVSSNVWVSEGACAVQTHGKRNRATPIEPKYGFILFRKNRENQSRHRLQNLEFKRLRPAQDNTFFVNYCVKIALPRTMKDGRLSASKCSFCPRFHRLAAIIKQIDANAISKSSV